MLRQQAKRYRRLKAQISDRAVVRAICDLEDEREMTAAELEKGGPAGLGERLRRHKCLAGPR